MSEHSRRCLLCTTIILLAGARVGAESKSGATAPVSIDSQAPLPDQPYQMADHKDACCTSTPRLDFSLEKSCSGASGTCNTCCLAPCCPSDRVWFTGEYLFWFLKDAPVPVPLLTTGPTASGGVIGKTGTAVAFGANHLNYDTLNGMRLGTGVWLNDEHTIGLEGGGFLLEQGSAGFSQSSSAAGSPVLARPFFDTTINAENVRLLALPGAFAGGLATSTSARLWGAEANFAGQLSDSDNVQLVILAGFRYLDLEENLRIGDVSALLPGGVTAFNTTPLGPPATTLVTDHFSARNNFYGGQVGGRLNYYLGKAVLNLTGKVAIGSTHQVVGASGTSTLLVPGTAPATVPGGLLAVSSNTGNRVRDEFAVLPEIGLNVGYRITRNLTAFAGYSFLYLSNVARPGDQIDRNVNPTLVPTNPSFAVPFGPPRPAPIFNHTDFYAHGVNLGLGLSF
jgi:Putative beta barrel porin-7 (BBP7)